MPVYSTRGGAIPQLERAAAGEAVVVAVPERDLVLAEPPAEEHLLAVAHRREVDEPRVEILDEHAEVLQGVDRTRELGGAQRDLVVHLGEPGGREAAAVARDPGGHVVGAGLRLVERTLRLHHPLDQRPNGREHGVGLVRCESPLQRAKYDRAAWVLQPQPVSPAPARGSQTCGSRWSGARRSASFSGAARRSGREPCSPGWCSSRTGTRTPPAGTIRP